jgi:hypothetical protein
VIETFGTLNTILSQILSVIHPHLHWPGLQLDVAKPLSIINCRRCKGKHTMAFTLDDFDDIKVDDESLLHDIGSTDLLASLNCTQNTLNPSSSSL